MFSPHPLLDLTAALVPAKERFDLERRGADPLGWSLLLGFVELFLGVVLLIGNAQSYIQPRTEIVAEQAVEMMESGRIETSDQAFGALMSGSVVWLSWALEPLTWLLASVALTGMARLIAFGVSRDVVGEPLVWIGLRIAQSFGGALGASRDQLRFGPERPDRLVREPGSDLVVLSARPKMDWSDRVTIEIEERFYRLRSTEERQDGTWWAYAYVLDEAPSNEIIRALIRYVPPPPSAGRPEGRAGRSESSPGR